MADETPSDVRLRREREETAMQLAVAQARREERINARLDNHEADIKELRVGQSETKHSLNELRAQVTRIEKAIGESSAAAQAVAKAAADTANKAISNRSFFLGVFAIVATVLGALLANGHL